MIFQRYGASQDLCDS